MPAAPTDVPGSRARGIVLSLTFVIVACFFALTHFINAAYQRERAALGRHWRATGDSDFAAGNAPAAVDAYRSALTYAPDDPNVTLRLAESLAGSGQEQQAAAYLLGLLQEEPGNGPVNLALARLSARRQDAAGAMRYFHGAIYGAWSGEGQVMRRRARLELIDFLLGRNDTTDARSELIGLTADLPRDPALLISAAERFARAGDDANALALYREAMSLHGGATPAAWTGAGMAAFRLADYRTAVDYLQRAKSADAAVATTLNTASAALELDPFARGLSTDRRRERMRRILDLATARVQSCRPAAAPNSIAPNAAGMIRQTELLQRLGVAQQELDRSREFDFEIATTMARLAREAEQANPQCGGASPSDAAVLLIARSREVQP